MYESSIGYTATASSNFLYSLKDNLNTKKMYIINNNEIINRYLEINFEI